MVNSKISYLKSYSDLLKNLRDRLTGFDIFNLGIKFMSHNIPYTAGDQLTTLSVHVFQPLSTLYLIPPLSLPAGGLGFTSYPALSCHSCGWGELPFTVHSVKGIQSNGCKLFTPSVQTLLDARALLLEQKVAQPPWQGASNSCRLRNCRGWSKAKCLAVSMRSCDSEHDTDHTLLGLSPKAGQGLSFLIDNHLPGPGLFREAQVWVGGEAFPSRFLSWEVILFHLKKPNPSTSSPQVVIRRETTTRHLTCSPPSPHTQERKLTWLFNREEEPGPKVMSPRAPIFFDMITCHCSPACWRCSANALLSHPFF